jgi:hypothetical protein
MHEPLNQKTYHADNFDPAPVVGVIVHSPMTSNRPVQSLNEVYSHNFGRIILKLDFVMKQM